MGEGIRLGSEKEVTHERGLGWASFLLSPLLSRPSPSLRWILFLGYSCDPNTSWLADPTKAPLLLGPVFSQKSPALPPPLQGGKEGPPPPLQLFFHLLLVQRPFSEDGSRIQLDRDLTGLQERGR